MKNEILRFALRTMDPGFNIFTFFFERIAYEDGFLTLRANHSRVGVARNLQAYIYPLSGNIADHFRLLV